MRIVTWNVCNTTRPTTVRKGIEAITKAYRPDVICLQETYKLYGALAGLGYQVIQFAPRKGDSERAECAILVRKGLKIKRGLAVRMARAWIGPKARVRHDGRTYRWTRVVLDGQVWKVGSVHQPFGPGPRKESRAAIVRLIRRTKAGRPTVIAGDYNEGPGVVRKEIAIAAAANVVGHGIDLAVYRNCQIVETVTLDKYGSDHRAVAFDFAAKAKPAPKPMTPVMGTKAIAAAGEQSRKGPAFAVGMCLQRCRMAYGIGAKASDAIGAWNAAKGKRRTSDPKAIPAGWPIFWSGGSSSHGHIAISAGNGKCWSTDIKRRGYFDLVDIDTIRRQWGLTLLGYTTDLNGKEIS